MKKWKAAVLIIFFIILLSSLFMIFRIEDKDVFKIGILPIEDTLPFIVAEEKGYFADAGAEVKLVMFQSALERDSAFQAGEVDAIISDLVAVILMRNSGMNVEVVSLILGTEGGEGRFALLASPQSGLFDVKDLQGEKVAVSFHTVIEFITDQLLLKNGISPQDVGKRNVPKIPIRLEMLLNNQVAAATLPEPLASFAEFKGATVLIDSAGTGLGQVVFAVSQRSIQERNEQLHKVMKAYDLAVKNINSSPEDFRPLLVKHARVPDPIKDTYDPVAFPPPQVPNQEQVEKVLSWLEEKELLTEEITYEQLVNDDFCR